jgi:hypothetical protein
MATDDDQEPRFNPKRRLCPDGSCVGILGSDGRCTLCGTRDPGEPPPEPETPAPRPSHELPCGDEVEVALRQEDEPVPAFDPRRRLCTDGACIGVIGSNNRCSACGKPG